MNLTLAAGMAPAAALKSPISAAQRTAASARWAEAYVVPNENPANVGLRHR